MADVKHMEILFKGVAHWNEWRHANQHITPDLSKTVMLKTRRYAGHTKSGPVPFGTPLKDITCKAVPESEQGGVPRDLRGINFENANLEGVALEDAVLDNAIFDNANLKYARMQECRLKGASFRRTNMESVQLQNATLDDATCEEARMQGANLWGASLRGTKILGSNTANATFWESDLTKAAFLPQEGAINYFKKTDFFDAKFKKTKITSPKALIGLKRPLSLEQQRGIIYLDNTQQILDEPFIELSEAARKSKRNLLVLSVMCLLMAFNIVDVSKFQLWNVTVPKDRSHYLSWCFMVATVYYIVHLVLTGWDTYLKYRLRRTGISKERLKRTGIADDEPAYGLGPVVEQHTAYADIIHVLQYIRDNLTQLKASTDVKETFDKKTLQEITRGLEVIEGKTPLLIHLTRRFWQHQKLVRNRFIFEFQLPLAVGGLATIALFVRTLSKTGFVSFACLIDSICK